MVKEYPHIQFRKHWELSEEVLFQLGQCAAIISTIAEMPIIPSHHQYLMRVSLRKGAIATTAIEGNTLTESQVEEIEEGKDLPPSMEYQQIEVTNVIDGMNELLDEVAVNQKESKVTPALLLRLHVLIGRNLGNHFDAIPGRFRTDDRAVGTYKCPDYRDVVPLVERLCKWLPKQFSYRSGDQKFLDALIEAIVSHVYLEWIHPFGDGNGRTGRLLEFYILLRAGNPDIASHILSNFYNSTRPDYYRHLKQAGASRDLTEFIKYAVQGLLDGLRDTLLTVQGSQLRTTWREYVYDAFSVRKYRQTVFKRRRNLILSLPFGKWLTREELTLVTTKVARDYAVVSPRTVTRDLNILREMGLLSEKNKKFKPSVDALVKQMPARLRELKGI